MENQENPKRKILILESEYSEENNLVVWKVRFLDDNSELTLAWHKNDLCEALLGKEVHASHEDMKKFCSNMDGKEISIVMSPSQHVIPTTGISGLSIEDMHAISSSLDSYPFYEVQSYLMGENKK